MSDKPPGMLEEEEIEDVLSAIRRLVAEDTRATDTRAAATPDLRLVAENSAPGSVAAETAEPPEAEPEWAPRTADGGTGPGHFEPDEMPDEPEPRSDDLAEAMAQAMELPVEPEPAHLLLTPSLRVGRISRPWTDRQASALEATIAELEAKAAMRAAGAVAGAADAAGGGTYVPASDGAPPTAPDAAVAAAWTIHVEPPAAGNAAAWPASPEDPPGWDEPAPGEPFRAAVWLDTGAGGANGDAGPEASASPVPPAPAIVHATVDEARLRVLIAEVLRAELQGELGEQASRNLVKLVHREVNRMFSEDVEETS